jgi:hypothetical protein
VLAINGIWGMPINYRKAVTPMNKWIALCSFIIGMTISSNSLAGSGTLTVTFKYKDNNGVEQPLSSAYIYLHDASKKPPLEKYFVNTPYIFGPSYSNGWISASVPEGSYYIRITKRDPLSGNTNRLGPPEPTDYTWSQTTPITISANVTTDLGTKYADSLPITVTGAITNYYSGVPVAGLYVRAQTEPCYTDGYNNNINHCGPVKFLALQRTDAGGRFTIKLRYPGTYYIYDSSCLQDSGEPYAGNPCMGYYGGTVTVNSGETKTLNIVTYY